MAAPSSSAASWNLGSLTNLAIVIVSALALYYVLLPQLYGDALASIPGPLLAKYSRLWLFHKVSQGDGHSLYTRLHAEYGPVVRIGPTKVIVSDPDLLPLIYGTRNELPKSDFYNAFQFPMKAKPLPGLANARTDNVFSTRDKDYHKRVKAVLTPAYSMITVKQLEPKFDQLIGSLVSKWKTANGRVVDLESWLTAFAFDAAGLITFNRPFGFLAEGKDHLGLISDVDVAIVYASLVGQFPWIHKFLLGNETLMKLLSSIPKIGEANAAMKVRNFLWHAEQEYSVEDEGMRGDLLSFLYVLRSKDKGTIDGRDVTGHLINNIFGGGDTTALAAQAVLYDLIRDPAAFDKLRNELDNARLSQPSKFVEANDLPYLKAVIKESIRLHPSVPMPLEREVTSTSGLRLTDTYILPPKTSIGASASAVNLSEKVFGPDAHVFRPERWLEDTTGVMDRTVFSFGAGSRLCIGRQVAMFELTKLIPEIVRNFNLEWAGEEATWDLSSFFFSRVKGGMRVRVRAREQ